MCVSINKNIISLNQGVPSEYLEIVRSVSGYFRFLPKSFCENAGLKILWQIEFIESKCFSNSRNFVKKLFFLLVLQKLLAAQLRELAKSVKNFLQGHNVSGNFVTKLPYYFQVWSVRPVSF